ncbi:hypothetical protein Oscil6304_2976 [Oscillatoria acuminata PCC 6304]|uniref:Uncharacterized protein n=2 Tax=Oscillatoria acuminata TaxID=118323 RepID=K9TKM7_9CYAN|nr:hypothetical protein Oscil6304_2976 [Oscillatoria acuminata PCC 6304]
MKFLSIATGVFLFGLIALGGGGGPKKAMAESFSGDVARELGLRAIAQSPEDTAFEPLSSDVQFEGVNPSPSLAAESENFAELLTGTTAITAPHYFMIPGQQTVPQNPATEAENNPVLAQRDNDIELGRTSRGVGNYIGAAINIGLSEDASPLGRGSFALTSKIGLAEQVSVRPSLLFGEHLMVMLPVTIDFPFAATEDTLQVDLAPYIGSGIALSTDEDNFIGFFGTVGIDRVLFDRFVANAALNVGYVEEIEVGIFVGGGYRF